MSEEDPVSEGSFLHNIGFPVIKEFTDPVKDTVAKTEKWEHVLYICEIMPKAFENLIRIIIAGIFCLHLSSYFTQGLIACVN